MGEQFKPNPGGPTEKETSHPQSVPNADVDTMTAPELLSVKASLEQQIREARKTEPAWADELQVRLDRINERLV